MFLPRSVLLVKPKEKSDSDSCSNPISQENTDSPTVDQITESPTVGQITESPTVGHNLALGGEDDDDDEPVVSYTAMQRWPLPGEPVCLVCGRYGAYIVDRTDKDVCSLECKAKHLLQLGISLTPAGPVKTAIQSKGEGSEGEGNRTGGDEYTPWRYREHGQVAGMNPDQVNTLKHKMGIKVEGSQVPRPIMEFGHLRLPEKLSSNLNNVGYTSLTPVQMQVIPATLYQRNLLVCASTGSGKTLSFLLPVILQLLGREPTTTTTTTRIEEATAVVRPPQCLILAPTRELAMQIEAQAKQLMKGLPQMKTALVVGGVSIANQLHRLRSGIELVVATPARLNDIIENHPQDIDLSHIRILVLDEVDCLLSMGFESQVRMIVELLPVKRQNMMFSATIPPRIERMAKELMKEGIKITIGEPGIPCEDVKHTVLWVEEASKKKKLLSFLRDKKHFNPPVVIFVSSKKGSLLLADTINKSSIPDATAVGLHGDMVQDRRSEIVREFLEGKHSVLVATSVLARGVDLVNVRQVFIFDFPFSLPDFIHQVGRAGRMGSPGNAITFINNSSKNSFLNFSDLLGRMGVMLPCQLTGSPYLALQREKRKRKPASTQAAGASERKKQKLEKNLFEIINQR